MPGLISALRGRDGARVVLAALAVTASFFAGAPSALASEPVMRVTRPATGSATNDTTPAIEGALEPEEMYAWCEVKVLVYAGAAEGIPREVLSPEPGECSWTVTPAAPLAQGAYTVVTRETDEWLDEAFVWHEKSEETGPVLFTVDTTPPAPSILSPAPGASYSTSTIPVSGLAGAAPGDLGDVTLQVFAGGEAAGSPLETVEAASSGGAWSSDVAGLAPGTYTLRAEQSDTAGNVGLSAPVSITVLAPAPPASPVASFTWLPSAPHVGEQVTLASDSIAPAVPLTGYAWSLGAGEPFRAGTPTLLTSFSKPGAETVRLQVTDALGRTSVATETIEVHHQALSLMAPFPVVRIAGRETEAGVKLSLLTVEAPVTAKVTVRIRRTKGKATSVSRVATAARAGRATALLSFPRFARAIPAGSVLEVLVSKAEQIGKLTRLIPRHGKLPTRQDLCLSPNGSPLACPS